MIKIWVEIASNTESLYEDISNNPIEQCCELAALSGLDDSLILHGKAIFLEINRDGVCFKDFRYAIVLSISTTLVMHYNTDRNKTEVKYRCFEEDMINMHCLHVWGCLLKVHAGYYILKQLPSGNRYQTKRFQGYLNYQRWLKFCFPLASFEPQLKTISDGQSHLLAIGVACREAVRHSAGAQLGTQTARSSEMPREAGKCI